MLQSCSIEPNMMGAPWLDRPSKITESELADLELNYENMLETIRNDTFGGLVPPKYNLNKYNQYVSANQMNNDQLLSFDIYPAKRNRNNLSKRKRPNVINNNSSLINNESGHLDISFNQTLNNSNNLLSSLEFHNNSRNSDNDSALQRINNEYQETQQALDRAEINLSVQRVRMQLNMTTSPSLSPIPHSNNNSIIDINYEYKMDQDDDDDDDNNNNNGRHDISLPFMSPSLNNATNDSIHSINSSINHSRNAHQQQQQRQQQRQQQQRNSSRLFIAESVSPPLFNQVQGRSQSEQPLINNSQLLFPSNSSTDPQNNSNSNNNNHINSPHSISYSFTYSNSDSN